MVSGIEMAESAVTLNPNTRSKLSRPCSPIIILAGFANVLSWYGKSINILSVRFRHNTFLNVTCNLADKRNFTVCNRDCGKPEYGTRGESIRGSGFYGYTESV